MLGQKDVQKEVWKEIRLTRRNQGPIDGKKKIWMNRKERRMYGRR